MRRHQMLIILKKIKKMNIYFNGINLNRLIIRRIRKVKLFNYLFPIRPGGGPEYSYRVWVRHLKKLKKYGIDNIPDTVAELGPGRSLGTGIASLLSGANSYYALDVQNYITKEELLNDFDALLKIFQNKKLDNDTFAFDLFPDSLLEKTLNEERIKEIRKDLEQNGANGKFIKYFAPWNDDNIVEYNSVDFIFSQCVLEHVDDLKDCYFSMFKWMKPGAYSSHLVDFMCHTFTKEWNGHWAFSEKQWSFIRGSKAWAINRQPASKHIELINDLNFSIIEFLRTKANQGDGIKRSKLNKEFSHLTNEDLETTFLDYLIRK